MQQLYNLNLIKALVFIATLPFTAQTQAVLYNPQTLYDSPGGFYEPRNHSGNKYSIL